MSPSRDPRRALRWERIRGPRALASLLIGTALGAGLSPVAPGTMGTVVGVPIAYFTSGWPIAWRLLLWLALFAAGTWAAKVFDELMSTGDNQNIVIDEVVGYGITAWTAGTEVRTMVAAFILFRIFDVLKPPPVRQMDRMSKTRAKAGGRAAAWWGGAGVMLDDVLAGFQGLIVIVILQKLGYLP